LSEVTIVVPPKSARIVGPLSLLSGIAAMVGGVFVAFQEGEPLILGIILGLIGLLLLFGGLMLWQPRGGIVVAKNTLMLGGQSARDTVQLPLERVHQVLAHKVQYQWGEEVHVGWVVETLSSDAPRFLLGESDDEHGLKHFAHQITASMGVDKPVYEEPDQNAPAEKPEGKPPKPVHVDGRHINFEVGTGSNFNYTILTGGLCMLIVSGLLIKGIADNNVFGFLFGPLFLFLGLLLVAIAGGKRKLIEELRIEAGPALIHNYLLFGFRFFRKQVPLDRGSYVRVRQRGLRGASLEVVSQGRVLHLAGGVHVGCRLDPQGMLWLGQTLQWQIRDAVLGEATTSHSPTTPGPPPEASEDEPMPAAQPTSESPD
jgi:hypothetical protein